MARRKSKERNDCRLALKAGEEYTVPADIAIVHEQSLNMTEDRETDSNSTDTNE